MSELWVYNMIKPFKTFQIYLLLLSYILDLDSISLFRPAAEVGRRLACLGDNFSEHYSNQLDCMVDSLNNDDAYNAFAEIARRWGII